jgi:uncharacterized protein (TIRG00374 family)
MVTATPPPASRRLWLKAGALLLGLGALACTFREVRVERVALLLSRLGPLGVLLAFLPQLAAFALDALAWRSAFSRLGQEVRYRSLLWIRVATEALVLAVPGGAVVAEPLKIPLLRRHAGLEVPSALAGVLARKYSVLSAQAVWLAIAALLGLLALSSARAGAPTPGIVAVVGVASLALGVAASSLRVLFSRGTLAVRIRAVLERLPSQALKRKLLLARDTFERTDGQLAAFFSGASARRAPVTWLFVAAWAAESVETFVGLRLLGLELDFATVACLEVSITLLRNVAFLLPAGIGVQDLGYALFLRSLGVADATELAAAFTLLKRSKELLLIVLGLGLLSSDQRALVSRPLPA